MFNIVGILLALLIAEFSHGKGMLVGWESPAGALGLALLVLVAGLPLVATARSRIANLRDLDQALLSLDPAQAEHHRQSLAMEYEVFMARLTLFRRGYDALTLLAFAAACFLFGWIDFVTKVLHVPRGLEPLPELAPYLLMLCAAWVNQWRTEKAVRPAAWTMREFVAFNLRGNLMLLAPIVLVSGVIFAIRRSAPVFDDAMASFQFLETLVQMAIMVLVVLFVPALVRFILPSKRLPEGSLRTRLTAFAAARKLRVKEIYVWQTRSRHIATAFVIGLVGHFRYVFLTDALLRELNEEEVEAVFAHELGHAAYKHLWWLILFLFTFSVVLMGLDQVPTWLRDIGFDPPWLGTALIFAGLVYGYVTFGYVSRRFERQADFFAIAHTKPEVLAKVFLKLGDTSGHDMRRHGWRHFSLEQRIKEIMLVSQHPELKRVFLRELLMGIAIAGLITALCAVSLAPWLREDYVTGRMSYAFLQYDRARVNEDAAQVVNWKERAVQHARETQALDEDYAFIGRLHVAIIDALEGRKTDEFEKLAQEVEERGEKTQDPARQENYRKAAKTFRQAETAARRAYANKTRFDDEFAKETAE